MHFSKQAFKKPLFISFMKTSSEGLAEVCRRTLVFIGVSKFSQEIHVSVAVWREAGVRHKTSVVEYDKVHPSDTKMHQNTAFKRTVSTLQDG